MKKKVYSRYNFPTFLWYCFENNKILVKKKSESKQFFLSHGSFVLRKIATFKLVQAIKKIYEFIWKRRWWYKGTSTLNHIILYFWIYVYNNICVLSMRAVVCWLPTHRQKGQWPKMYTNFVINLLFFNLSIKSRWQDIYPCRLMTAPLYYEKN